MHKLYWIPLFTEDKYSLRNLFDLRDGNDDSVGDHDGHGSQLLLQRPSANGSSPLGSQVSRISDNQTSAFLGFVKVNF